jgi:DNA polymerase bacteriophage-type
MAMTYRMDLELMAEKAYPTLPAIVRQDAQGMWDWANRTHRTLGLPERVYVVCEALKRMWRDAHPNVVLLWERVLHAACLAVENPGKEFGVNDKLVFQRKGAWLRVRLPSGRYLCYPAPKFEGRQLSYAGSNTYSRKWGRLNTYGGKLVENITQAASRDVMAEAMLQLDRLGFPIVLTVHDEVVCEVPDHVEFTDKDVSRILATNAPWNQGLPLAAKGFTTYRYRKD